MLSEELDKEVELAVARLQYVPAAARVVAGQASAGELARYYVNAHAIVQHATHFLAQSGLALQQQGGSALLADLFEQKVSEERGHDAWLEEDLAAIGLPLGAVNTPEPGAASAAYNAFHGPVAACRGEAFLGTAWVLESLAVRVAPTAARNLREAGRIRGIARGLRFLEGHGEADVGHMAELRQIVDTLVVDASAQAYVRMSARFTATVYADLF